MSTIVEPLGAGLTRVWELSEVLVDVDTEFQHLVIARTAQGVALFCDDDRQSTEFSQLVYHEALMVPGFLLARELRRVLIIGSSEGVASQLAVAAGAEVVHHVDIDREAVELCAEHLPYGYTTEELDDAVAALGPVHVRYADGLKFLTDALAEGTRYDLVVVDLPDEAVEVITQYNRLYETEFLERCRDVLTEGGAVAYQAGCPTMWRNETLHRAWRRFTTVFDTAAYFGSDEHEWAFVFGTNVTVPDPVETMSARLATLPYRPTSIDADAVRGNSVPPHSVRHAGTAPIG